MSQLHPDRRIGLPGRQRHLHTHSLLLGFGLEGVSTEAERNTVMGRALDHLVE
jgi:hypothetical protein